MNWLNNISIVDFTRLLPGPLATNILAQMGASVIKVESPNRMDYVRQQGKQVDGASVLFHQLNHRKEKLIIDYESEEGKVKLFDLIKKADVLIEQFRPGAMDAWGFSYKALQAINPKIIYVSLTGYSQNSNFKNKAGHDLNYMAYSGALSLSKDENGKPMVPGTQYSDIAGSYMAIMAIQAAIIKRFETGVGEYINVSLANAIQPFLTIPYSLYKSDLNHQDTNILNGNTVANYAVYECADKKWIAIAAFEMKFWNQFCTLVNKEDWKAKNIFSLVNATFDKEKIQELMKSKSREEWIQFFQGKDVCIAPVLEIEELEKSNYHTQNKSFEKFTLESGEELMAIRFSF